MPVKGEDDPKRTICYTLFQYTAHFTKLELTLWDYYQELLVIRNIQLSQWITPKARAITEATAEKVADFIYEQIICQHGCPQIMLSDRGTYFNNKMVAKLLEKFEINHLLSTSYHPQTNGLVERFNRTLCESLAKLSLQTNDWDLFIAPTLFAYRTTKHSTTKIEPFFLMYGRPARLPIDYMENETQKSVHDRIFQLIDNVSQIREKARSQITNEQRKQKDRHD